MVRSRISSCSSTISSSRGQHDVDLAGVGAVRSAAAIRAGSVFSGAATLCAAMAADMDAAGLRRERPVAHGVFRSRHNRDGERLVVRDRDARLVDGRR